MAQGKFIGQVVLWVFAFLVFVLNIIMNVFARGVQTEEIGIFLTSVQNLSNDYVIDMSPAIWVHWYWIAIAVWQLVWMLYGVASFCRKGVDDEPLSVSPELTSIPVYALFLFANGLHIGNLFLWDRDYRIPGLVFMALLMVTLWIALGLSCWDLSKNLETLYDYGLEADAWIVRFLLHNGLAIVAGYCTFAFFLELNVVIQYDSNYDPIDSTTVCLSLFVFFIIVYFILDITVLDHWLRYVFTPYISVAYIFGSIIDRNWGPVWLQNYRNPTYVATVLGVVCVFGLMKILVMSVRSVVSPTKPSNTKESTIDDERGY